MTSTASTGDRATLAQRGARPLAAAHFQWWRRAYGTAYEAAAPPSVVREPSTEELDALFCAIRDNHVGHVQRILDVYPHLGFTKRTALYVASFFARFEVAKLLLARGADRLLCADGVPPSAVVGYGRSDAVDELKLRCLLADSNVIHVLLILSTRASDSTTSISPIQRVHIHFSEPVDDFIEDDFRMENCTLEKFTQVSRDFFTATVRVIDIAVNSTASIQVPAGVARGLTKRDDQNSSSNSASNILQLR